MNVNRMRRQVERVQRIRNLEYAPWQGWDEAPDTAVRCDHEDQSGRCVLFAGHRRKHLSHIRVGAFRVST